MELSIVLAFLEQLKKNNDREWFQAHKNHFNQAKIAFEELIQCCLSGIKKFDRDLESTEAKDCIYRIYRDIRFSKDKTPYKTNFGAVMAPGGRKTTKALYYLQMEPGDLSFLAGGLYMPESSVLKKVRQEIDYNVEGLQKILGKEAFQKYFPSMEGEKLSRAPKGYNPNDPNIEYLKHKSFLVVHRFDDKIITTDKFTEMLLDAYQEMKPFISYLNTAIS